MRVVLLTSMCDGLRLLLLLQISADVTITVLLLLLPRLQLQQRYRRALLLLVRAIMVWLLHRPLSCMHCLLTTVHAALLRLLPLLLLYVSL